MPIISEDFPGSVFRMSGHLETIIPALFRRKSVYYNRERIITQDNDFIDLDWIKQGQHNLLILLHGLEGSTNSQYMQGMADYFNQRNWDICAVNFRSCSGSMNLVPQSYHSGKTDDVDWILKHITKKNDYLNIAITGFSLGGNVALKYAAEYASKIPELLKTIVAVSAPVNLEDSAKTMAKLSNRLYMYRFLKSLNGKMMKKSLQFPNLISVNGINKIRTFHEFDGRYTAPLHGFKDAHDYYEKCSAVHTLDKIRLPILLLNALNDPFLGKDCYPTIPFIHRSNLFANYPKFGGHVGFAEQFPNQEYYTEKTVFEFISKQIFK